MGLTPLGAHEFGFFYSSTFELGRILRIPPKSGLLRQEVGNKLRTLDFKQLTLQTYGEGTESVMFTVPYFEHLAGDSVTSPLPREE